MSRQRRPQVITENVEAHPAVRAWARLGAGQPRPEAVEFLRKADSKTPVVRLVLGGGASVIAKNADPSSAMIEKTMYENAARYLSVATLRCYGCVEAEEGSSWLFTEDAGGGSFSFRDDRHARLAAAWLAELHTSIPNLECLPERGIGHYGARLTSARGRIAAGMGNPALREGDRALLQTILVRLDLVAQEWGNVRALGGQLPQGLIHGDFKARNLRVRDEAGGSALLVFDWAEAGWGVPGIDMWRVDPESYRQGLRGRWPRLTREDILHLAGMGRLLWCLKAIDWEAENLAFAWFDETMDCLRVYERHLTESLGQAGLLP